MKNRCSIQNLFIAKEKNMSDKKVRINIEEQRINERRRYEHSIPKVIPIKRYMKM